MTAAVSTANFSSFPQRVPPLNERDFVPGRIETRIEFWANTIILTNHPCGSYFFAGSRPSTLDEFVDPNVTDVF